MAFWKRVWHYVNITTLFKKGPKNLNLRFMHGMNRISIILFLVALAVMIIRWITRG